MKSYGRSITLQEIKNEEKSGKIYKNLVDPIRKDTISIPNKGFAILRLKTDNPGRENDFSFFGELEKIKFKKKKICFFRDLVDGVDDE